MNTTIDTYPLSSLKSIYFITVKQLLMAPAEFWKMSLNLVYYVPFKQQPSINKIMISNGGSGASYQLADILFIYSCCYKVLNKTIQSLEFESYVLSESIVLNSLSKCIRDVDV